MNTDIQPRRQLIRNILLIALGLLGLWACASIVNLGLQLFFVAALNGLGDSRCASSRPQEIEKVAGIKLPPSTTHLQSTCDGLNNWWAEAYFDMKPSDLAAFVSSTRVKLPLSTTGKPNKLECVPCNSLTNLKSYLYGYYYVDERQWLEEIFIDTSNPARYHVYYTLQVG